MLKWGLTLKYQLETINILYNRKLPLMIAHTHLFSVKMFTEIGFHKSTNKPI